MGFARLQTVLNQVRMKIHSLKLIYVFLNKTIITESNLLSNCRQVQHMEVWICYPT